VRLALFQRTKPAVRRARQLYQRLKSLFQLRLARFVVSAHLLMQRKDILHRLFQPLLARDVFGALFGDGLHSLLDFLVGHLASSPTWAPMKFVGFAPPRRKTLYLGIVPR
jgi:hypothetical protein